MPFMTPMQREYRKNATKVLMVPHEVVIRTTPKATVYRNDTVVMD